MSLVCDFDVHLRIVASDGTTVLGDLNDQASGLSLMRPIVKPDGDIDWTTYTAAYAIGDFTSGMPKPAAGDLLVTVLAEGSSWVQTNTRWRTVAAPAEDVTPGWLNAESTYFVELEEDGMVTRWRTRRPPVIPLGYDRINNRLTHQVRFHVQPNPVVTL